jgi:hypothetical protein
MRKKTLNIDSKGTNLNVVIECYEGKFKAKSNISIYKDINTNELIVYVCGEKTIRIPLEKI